MAKDRSWALKLVQALDEYIDDKNGDELPPIDVCEVLKISPQVELQPASESIVYEEDEVEWGIDPSTLTVGDRVILQRDPSRSPIVTALLDGENQDPTAHPAGKAMQTKLNVLQGHARFWKSPVDTSADLTATSTEGEGTVRLVLDTNTFYRFEAGSWSVLGGGSVALDDLTDVAITTPASGHILQYNGASWVNLVSPYAPIASPTFTGVPAGPTAAVDTNTTQLATTAYVIGQGYLKSATAASTYAPLASPTFTGTPLSTTAAVDTNTTQIATTAFVIGQGYLKSATAASTYAPLASPTFTGVPLSTTAAVDTNTTQIATTAFVIGQGYLKTATAASTYAPLAGATFSGAVTQQVVTNYTENSFSGSTNLSTSGARVYRYTGTGGHTATLPTTPTGTEYVLINNGSASLTVAGNSSDTVNGAASVTLPSGWAMLVWGVSSTASRAMFMPPSANASAITVDSTTLVGTGTDVQAVFEELDNAIADHLADTTDAHDASAISYAGGTGMSATDVEAAVDELATEKLDITSKHGYCLMGFAGPVDPADATNYYVGGTPAAAAWSTSTTAARIYVPVAGTVTAAYVRFVSTVAGSSENITVSLCVDGSVSEDIEVLGASSTERIFNKTSLNTAVTPGQYINLKIACPTWATNPTGVSITASIYIEPS